jgi:hypothetical protein
MSLIRYGWDTPEGARTMYQIAFTEIFPVRRRLIRRWRGIITKFANAEDYPDGEPGLMLIFSKQMSAEKIHLAETKR